MDLQKVIDQLRGLWARLRATQRAAAIAILIALAAVVGFATLRTPEIKEAVLFSNLPPEDAGAVLEKIIAAKIPYRLSDGGTTIFVPEERAPELRIQIASAGLPRGGSTGFELFDKQTFGTSSFVEQMNYNRALSGELARSIGSLDAVERARIHLAMPERSLYSKEDEPPSASVILRLRAGRALSPQQVRGIVHLVASSVPRLVADRVTVVAEGGEVLWSGDRDGAGTDSQRDLERTLARRITEITDRIVGPGHSSVVVTAELDQAQTERTEESYDKERAAIRSESRTEDRTGADGAGTAGVAGSRATSGTPTSSTAAGRSKVSETKNFEISRVISKTVGPRSQLKRLHVAIIVDGVATTTAAGSRAQRPRTSAEIGQIALLAREAAGLDASRGDRIEVHSVPFFGSAEPEPTTVAPPPPSFQPTTVEWVGIAAASLVLLVIVAALARRALKRRPIDADTVQMPALPLSVSAVESALIPPAPVLALPPASPREMAMRAARDNAARAAEVLAAWLDEPMPIEPRTELAPAKELSR